MLYACRFCIIITFMVILFAKPQGCIIVVKCLVIKKKKKQIPFNKCTFKRYCLVLNTI